LRIEILRSTSRDEVDGVDLRRFIADEFIPFSESDPFMPRVVDGNSPPNLTRETYRPYADDIPLAADLERRKHKRAGDD
jgi:hypothetical protein